MGKKNSKDADISETGAPDPAAAKKAFEASLPRIKGVAKDTVASINLDVQDAVIVALRVARFVKQAGVRKRFGLLHKDLFDQALLDDLETRALSAHHAQGELTAARALSSEAKLPLSLVDKASEVKERMLEVVGYTLKKDTKVAKRVAAIRPGTGYKDLSSDLSQLAAIYEEKHDVVSKDAVNYRSSDAKDARILSQEIVKELGEGQNEAEKKWLDLTSRAWTLLRDCYEEVQWGGGVVYRHEDPEEKFPSLYSANASGRPAKSAAKKKVDEKKKGPGEA